MRRCSRRRVSLVCIKAPDVQMESAIYVRPGPLSNPRMQPTGRMGARLRSGAAFLERAVERRFVWAPAGGAAADAPFVRRTLIEGGSLAQWIGGYSGNTHATRAAEAEAALRHAAVVLKSELDDSIAEGNSQCEEAGRAPPVGTSANAEGA